MSTSEVSRTQSHNFAVSTTSQGTVTIHHLKSRFAKNDFRVYVSKPGCRANLRSACQFQWNYEEVYATDIYLLESLTTAENLQFGERWIIVVPCQRRHWWTSAEGFLSPDLPSPSPSSLMIKPLVNWLNAIQLRVVDSIEKEQNQNNYRVKDLQVPFSAKASCLRVKQSSR